VVGAAGEVVGEELLGGAELTTGSTERGNDRRRLPLARCSRRKMTVGGIRWPSLASRRYVQTHGAGGEQ
jgi:hypothetical protein